MADQDPQAKHACVYNAVSKGIARELRREYPELRIEAHPESADAAKLLVANRSDTKIIITISFPRLTSNNDALRDKSTLFSAWVRIRVRGYDTSWDFRKRHYGRYSLQATYDLIHPESIDAFREWVKSLIHSVTELLEDARAHSATEECAADHDRSAEA